VGLIATMVRRGHLDFLPLWLQADRFQPVRGWLAGIDAYLLYSAARNGPGQGAIVEIGSAWGRSTVFLAAGSMRAKREKVIAIDPHTGDDRFLRGIGPAPFEKRLARRHVPPLTPASPTFNSFEEFSANIRKFGLGEWVEPVVATSMVAARRFGRGAIRLLFIDGLHTYQGVASDISDWVPRVCRGGIVVFDDYFNEEPEVGVRRAVDELLGSGLVEPAVHRAHSLAWITKL
jgi:MMP 1-O-methyltransferase